MEYQYVLLAVVILALAWQLRGMIMTARKITLPGKMPGRLAGMILFLALVAFAMWRQKDNMTPVLWVTFGLMIVVVVVYMTTRVGLGDEAVYAGGRRMYYGDVNYYSLERETESYVVLRVSTARREFNIQFPPDQKELLIAHMIKHRVPSFDQYADSERQRRK